MPVDSPHPQYTEFLPLWQEARDVLGGEKAVKAAGTRYLPKLTDQDDEEYQAYKTRASFFNATARTAEAYLGLIFRRQPFIKAPEDGSLAAKALTAFSADIDL